MLSISIHAPARGATVFRQCPIYFSIFQSTLPQGERRACRASCRYMDCISIHAPARGATSRYFCAAFSKSISIHAPARGATRVFRDEVGRQITISIHAPARGATYGGPNRIHRIRISIHAPARGATGWPSPRPQTQQFQSTLPQGERPGVNLIQTLIQDFNPRSRKGSDGSRKRDIEKAIKFQSTLPQGERLTKDSGMSATSSFQSTLPQGERPLEPSTLVRYQIISIHAPARGATLLPVWPSGKTSISIHAPARGATQPGLQPVHW